MNNKLEIINKNITNKNIINKNIINKNIIIGNDKKVNYSCFCNKFFYCNEKILYVIPCCHIIHETCFNNYILKKQYKIFEKKNNNLSLDCPFCKETIKSVLSEYKINSKKKYNQYKIDIKSIRIDNSAPINYMILPVGILKLTSFMNKLILVNSTNELLSTVELIIKDLNIKINIIDNTKNNPIEIKNNTVFWKNFEDNNRKLVIISNHSHYLDSIIIYYLFRCGFISSDFILHTDIGKIIATKLKLLIFRRGVDTNMVEKTKEYLNETNRIAMYPEGALGNNETIMRFRTGAFYVNETICPVVIKYNKIVYDDDFKQMLFKLITQSEMIINVYINDFFYPPFNDEKIEQVRDYMAKIGNLDKSRVSNKTIKE